MSRDILINSDLSPRDISEIPPTFYSQIIPNLKPVFILTNQRYLIKMVGKHGKGGDGSC